MQLAFAPSLPLFEQEALNERSGSIIEDVLSFNADRRPTVHMLADGIDYYINEFWTARQRQAHSIHEISYRACFKGQLPEFFISRLTEEGEGVHDPFMGRGTTPIQSALMRRRPHGNDINPLSVLLTRPRLRAPSLLDIARRLETVPWDATPAESDDDLLAFYHPDTLRQLLVLKAWLLERAPLDNSSPDPVDDWIRMVAINRLSGHSPGFFSGRSMPRNQAVSIKAQLKINEKLGVSPPARNVAKIIIKKSKSLLSDGYPPKGDNPILSAGLADSTPEIPSGSVSLTITSPPFLDIVQYASDNWLRCWFAGIDVKSVAIAMHKDEESWTSMVRNVLREQARILKSGGHVAFEVGEVRGGRILLEKLVWQAAETLPFERLGVMVNDQEFTKTANCWGVGNNTAGTNTNRIVLLRRH